MTTLTDHDIYLFREVSHARLYEKLGCHFTSASSDTAHFAVWAPSARAVSVIGDFNGWDATEHEMKPRWDGSGVWEADVTGVQKGAAYKYRVVSQYGSSH